MKSLRHNWQLGMATAALTLLAFAPRTLAAGTNAAPAAVSTNAAAGGTNAATAEIPVPLSVFSLAAQPTKDPFFPMSTRQPVGVTNSAAPAFSTSEFILKGLSGTAHNRLALINNRTLADGEQGEITTPSGKIKIRCLEIKEGSVIISFGPQHETTEVFLRKSAR